LFLAQKLTKVTAIFAKIKDNGRRHLGFAKMMILATVTDF